MLEPAFSVLSFVLGFRCVFSSLRSFFTVPSRVHVSSRHLWYFILRLLRGFACVENLRWRCVFKMTRAIHFDIVQFNCLSSC